MTNILWRYIYTIIVEFVIKCLSPQFSELQQQKPIDFWNILMKNRLKENYKVSMKQFVFNLLSTKYKTSTISHPSNKFLLKCSPKSKATRG